MNANGYAKLSTDRESITKIISDPKWYDKNGNLITDDRIFIYEGLVPIDIDSEKPQINTVYQRLVPNDTSQWKLISGDTEVLIYNSSTAEFESSTINTVYKVCVTYTVKSQTVDDLKNYILDYLKQLRKNQRKSTLWPLKNVEINASPDDLVVLQSLYDKTADDATINFRLYDNSFITITKSDLADAIKTVQDHLTAINENLWQRESYLQNDLTLDFMIFLKASISTSIFFDLTKQLDDTTLQNEYQSYSGS